tara:strand:+ start:49 stop:360 length:312 start_codon:yes stop_codon:yes gene_type:complete
MSITKLLSIRTIKNKDFFDIRSFVLVFSIYSIISIACADRVYNQSVEIKILRQELKSLKTRYISTRTVLMNERKASKLLRKAELFGFIPASNPPKVIYLNNEN